MKKVPSLHALNALRDQLFPARFTCKTCLAKHLTSNVSPRRRLPSSSLPSLSRGSRSASQVASATTIDAKKQIPIEFKELYDLLKALGELGSAFVNASQLQLALRGLESTGSVIRVAGIFF